MKQVLLTILKGEKEKYVSGEELSRQLGVSRTAVWKHIGRLRDEGYRIESLPRLGYRLVSVPDLLLPAEIAEGLVTSALGRKIYHYHKLDSTNRLARELCARGEPEGSLVVAEVQDTGRGRLGRSWSSPAGGIWMTLILRPKLASYQLPLITLTAAVAAVEATLKTTGLKPGIKWPNDLLLSGRKLVGILTEVSAETDRVNHCVLGVGVNANIPPERMPSELQGLATSLLAETGKPVDRAAWVRNFLESMETYYLNAASDQFHVVRMRWKEFSETLGREVTVRLGERSVHGMALDIDESGALQVRTPNGVETMMAGEVTLKPVN
jgi:BirA family biotin operon repressor/biotin-[acetyl-CoA-carboxylase] ligase